MPTDNRIVATTWWTPATGGLIGAVLIKDPHDWYKSYIGSLNAPHGLNEHDDADMIARLGAKLSEEQMKGVFSQFF
jgi:hypothetical protein